MFALSVIAGTDNQEMTVRVRVRQVSADRRQFNVEMCRDFDNVAVHARWPLMTGSPKVGTTVLRLNSRQTY